MVGARLVLPGPNLDGASIYHLLDTYRVTFTAGVPTVWLGLLHYMTSHGIDRFRHLRSVAIAGSAPPRSMIAALEE
jgi:fatty-acyl-CoA synthase